MTTPAHHDRSAAPDTGVRAARGGMLLVISGPSGVGKTTITHQVEKALGGTFSVSMTTRNPAPGDIEGVDYYFVDSARFEQARRAGELLEWAQVFGNYYGTPLRPVVDALAAGKLMILEIDVEGAIQIKQKLPEALALFVLPPSEQVLLQRLRGRRREDEAVIMRRFSRAKDEIYRAQNCNIYDHFLINDDLTHAVGQAVQVVEAELARRRAGVRA